MNKVIVILVVIMVVGIGGFFAWSAFSNQESKSEQKMTQDKDTMMEVKPMGNNDSMMMEESSYGDVVSGSSSPFVEFSQEGYEKAIADGKIVFLDFYADWCPICRVEAPIINSGFEKLTTDKVVGFRVNFKDAMTDESETALAKELNIPYQHTKVFLVNGKEVERYPDQWDKEDFDNAFEKVLQ